VGDAGEADRALVGGVGGDGGPQVKQGVERGGIAVGAVVALDEEGLVRFPDHVQAMRLILTAGCKTDATSDALLAGLRSVAAKTRT
jgi:hypothetical protein